MTQPTAAAMRATLELFGDCLDCDSDKANAETIDNATGLPELIEACEAARQYVAPIVGFPKATDLHAAIENALRIAREGRS